jgi:hypothetical protein
MYWACSVAEEKEMKPTIARCVGKHRFGSFTYRRRKRRSFAIPRVILAHMHMIYGDIIFMHEYVFNAGHVQTVCVCMYTQAYRHYPCDQPPPTYLCTWKRHNQIQLVALSHSNDTQQADMQGGGYSCDSCGLCFFNCCC